MHVHHLRKAGLFGFFSLISFAAPGQRYLSDYDSSLFIRDTLRPLAKRFANLNVSGYMQPQFQLAQSKGAPSYSGGDFSEFSNSRFMLRRARIKFDYALPSKEEKPLPNAVFTFQIDATERGVSVKDMFLRVYEPAKQDLSLTLGLVARPFGFEVNLSSSYRETPERGRMSQILMPSERDLGATITYEPAKPGHKNPVKFDIGLFNGQGLAGTTDFDGYKDLISRVSLKPLTISEQFFISGGLSFLNGGWRQATKYVYEMSEQNASKFFAVDSSISNIGDRAPRRYFGADLQFGYKHHWGKTEVRGEYWRGKQPGTSASTTNPGTLPFAPTYIRNFDGAFFYFLQNIVNEHWELMAKYVWYDPNVKAKGKEIGATNLTEADIRFSTLGFGITRYFSDNLKVLAYYDLVKNENTLVTGFDSDIRDNIFTLRMQVKF